MKVTGNITSVFAIQKIGLTIAPLIFLFSFVSQTMAAELKVAVASNFMPTMRNIAAEFEQDTGHSLILMSGSSGKLYAQIVRGAPFDVFFAADEYRPQKLEKAGLIVDNSRMTYALGRLALWSPHSSFDEGVAFKDAFTQLLNAHDGRWHLAIANPASAPYGAAAQQVLQGDSRWQVPRQQLVYGENINQVFQFAETGHADFALVALSQMILAAKNESSLKLMWHVVPENAHTPIVQQAVVMTESGLAAEFMAYVQSDKMRALISEAGYQLP